MLAFVLQRVFNHTELLRLALLGRHGIQQLRAFVQHEREHFVPELRIRCLARLQHDAACREIVILERNRYIALPVLVAVVSVMHDRSSVLGHCLLDSFIDNNLAAAVQRGLEGDHIFALIRSNTKAIL